jgi:mono/diheme cytochrome c family protein
LLLLACALASCVEPPPPKSAPTPDPAPPAPPVAPRPADPTPAGAVVRARELYSTHCVTCHGVTGAGDAHFKSVGIPDFTDSKWHARESDAALAKVISTGKGKFMPAWGGKLTAEEIAALVRLIRAFPDRTNSSSVEG